MCRMKCKDINVPLVTSGITQHALGPHSLVESLMRAPEMQDDCGFAVFDETAKAPVSMLLKPDVAALPQIAHGDAHYA